VVPVGDSAEVELIFTAAKSHGMTVAKNATVTCNDNDRGNFQLQLLGKIYDRPDSLNPFTLSSINIPVDQKLRNKDQKIVVKNVSKIPLKMKLISYPVDAMEVDVPDKEVKPGKDKEIKVKLLSSFKDVEFKKSFTFEVEDSVKTRYTIPVLMLSPVVVPPQQGAAIQQMMRDTAKGMPPSQGTPEKKK
jgi:hypothetical protein